MSQDPAGPAYSPDVQGENALWWRIAGAAMLLLAAVASLVLALNHLRAIDLPFCGGQSSCAALMAGRWGNVAGWPVAFAGLAFFVSLLVAWLVAPRAGFSRGGKWIVRCGGALSLFYLVLMLIEEQFCRYCTLSHAGFLAFWLLLESTPARPASGLAGAAFLTSVAVVSAVLAVVQERVKDQSVQRAETDLANSVRYIVGISRAVRQPAQDNSRPFEGRYRRGQEKTAIRLVVFTDYQCVYCQRLEAQILGAMQGHDDISFSVKHFPQCSECNSAKINCKDHPNACRAAWAAEAAGILGGNEGFWMMHHWLLSRAGVFDKQQLTAALPQLGFDDQQRFFEVFTGQEVKKRVLGDVRQALELGVESTPILYCNGARLRGLTANHALQRAIQALRDYRLPERTAAADRPTTRLDSMARQWRNTNRIDVPSGKSRWLMGEKSAPVRVLFFTDDLSDYAKKASRALRDAMAQCPQARLEVFHFPYSPGSLSASRLIEAAGRLGGEAAFWKMHDWVLDHRRKLLQGQESIEGDKDIAAKTEALVNQNIQDSINQAAQHVEIDPQKVGEEYASDDVKRAVQADIKLGADSGVNWSPRIYIDGRLVTNNPPIARLLVKLIEAAQERTQGQ